VSDRVDYTVNVLLRRDAMNDSIQTDALLIQSLNQDDGVFQPLPAYEWCINIHFSVGTDRLVGSSKSLFRLFDEQDRTSVGIDISY